MLCGHLHKTIFEEPSSLIKFPIVVNSNESALSADISQNKIDISIITLDGKVVFKKTFNAK